MLRWIDPDELDRRADEASAEDAELLRTVEECRRRLQEAISAREEAEQRDEEAHGTLSGITRQIADRREKIDLFFTMARYDMFRQGNAEERWQSFLYKRKNKS